MENVRVSLSKEEIDNLKQRIYDLDYLEETEQLEFGYLVGWLLREINRRLGKLNQQRTQNRYSYTQIKTWSMLKQVTINDYKKANCKMRNDDVQLKHLISMVFAGYATFEPESDKLSQELMNGMVLTLLCYDWRIEEIDDGIEDDKPEEPERPEEIEDTETV